jgi:hypothetical protein
MEFMVDRYNAGARLGQVMMWQSAENLKKLYEHQIDWIDLQRQEVRKLGIDFWLQLRMNDWHHSNDCCGQDLNLLAGRFYVDHPEYLIGKEAIKDLPQSCSSIAWFQDYTHEEVRQLRLDVLKEAATRYDIDGFQYDFMRCPGYFKPGYEADGMAVMTELIRKSQTILKDIGKQRGKYIGLSVRVPNTIHGAENLGLDVRTWINEGLVDIVVPSTFFMADTEEDMAEWTELARNTEVGIYPAIEQSYLAGHTGGVVRLFYHPPIPLAVTEEMGCAIAARHYFNEVNGLYLMNWFRIPAVNKIADREHLPTYNKTYTLMRCEDVFPNCLPKRQIPIILGEKSSKFIILIADDCERYRQQLSAVKLWVHYTNISGQDDIEVKINGKILSKYEVKELSGEQLYMGMMETWRIYDLKDDLPKLGNNEIDFRILKRPSQLEKEFSIEVADLEIRIEYSN